MNKLFSIVILSAIISSAHAADIYCPVTETCVGSVCSPTPPPFFQGQQPNPNYQNVVAQFSMAYSSTISAGIMDGCIYPVNQAIINLNLYNDSGAIVADLKAPGNSWQETQQGRYTCNSINPQNCPFKTPTK